MRGRSFSDMARRGASAWPALLFLVLVVLFAPRALAGRAVLAPVDMLDAVGPYRELIDRPPEVASPWQTDQVEGLPNTMSFYRDLRAGHLQLYHPGIAGGSVTGTLPLWGLWSPFHIGYLITPEWYAPAIRVALALFSSMSFTYLFLRELRLGKYAAVLGAIAFTFNGTNLVLMNRIMAVFLLPALLWAVVRALRRPTAAAVGLIALFTAWLWFEGFPSGFVYAVFLAAGYTAWIIAGRLLRPWDRVFGWARTPIGPGVLVGVGLVWGVLLTTMTLLPFARELANSGYLAKRIYDSTSHLPAAQIFSLVDVNAGGPPLKGPFWTGTNPVEGGSLVGLIVLVGAAASVGLSAFGRLRLRSRDAVATWNFFCVVTPLLMIALFFGTPILGALYKMPGLGQGPMHRARYVIAFGFAVLAAMGFDSVAGGARARTDPGPGDPDVASRWSVSRWIGPVSLVAGLAALACAGPSFWSAIHSDQFAADDPVGVIGRSVLTGLALVAAAVVATFVGWRWSRLVPVTMVVIAGLLFVQLAVPFRKFTPQVPVASFFPETPSHRVLQNLTDRGDRYRFASTMTNFYPNSAMINDLSDLRGLTVAGTQFRDLVLAANPTAFTRDNLKLLLARAEWNLASPVYDELALGYFALDESEVPFGDVAAVDETWTQWAPGPSVAGRPVPPPPGPDREIAGVSLPLRFVGPQCSHGRAIVSITDGLGRTAGAWRPITDLAATWTDFAVLGDPLDRSSPLSTDVRFEGPGECSIDIGTVAAGSGTDGGATMRPAVRWYVDNPDDGVRLVSVDGSWIYERPTAQPILAVYDAWKIVPDRDQAIEEIEARRPGDSYQALIEGQPPDWVHGGDAGPAAIKDSRVDEDQVQLTVEAGGTALVAIRENYAPDWEATVDGQAATVLKLNGTQLSLFVPAGRHDVRLLYRPQAFVKGFMVSALAALALLAVAARSVVRTCTRRRVVSPGP